MLFLSRGEWKFQWGKYEWKNENKKKKIRENPPSFLQKLGAFLQNKSVSGSSFGYLPAEIRQV